MTLLSYEVFVTVSEQKSFQKAADKLQLTPSAISHAISGFENELGFTLFIRGRKNVSLTSYGEDLLPYVRAVLNSDEYLHQAIAGLNGLQKGTVKIGTFNSVCIHWLPELVQTFHQLYPNIVVEIYQGTYEDVSQWVQGGDVDLGFISVSSAGTLPITPLYKDRLVCVAPYDFETIDPDCVTIDEMKDQIFVTQRESCDADIQNFLQKYNFNVHSNCHVVDDSAAIAMVMGGMGICIMPELIMKNISYPVKVCPIKPEEYRIIGLTVLNSTSMAPAVQKFYEHVTTTLREQLPR